MLDADKVLSKQRQKKKKKPPSPKTPNASPPPSALPGAPPKPPKKSAATPSMELATVQPGGKRSLGVRRRVTDALTNIKNMVVKRK